MRFVAFYLIMTLASGAASDPAGLRGIERRMDSVCGDDSRFMATLACKDGAMLRFCAPNNLENRDSFCLNPNKKWSAAKCNAHGGFHELVTHMTGCFPCNGNCDAMCNMAPFDMSDATLGLANGGFEDGVLAPWVHKPSQSGQTAPIILTGNNPEGSYYLSIKSRGPSPNIVTRNDVIVGTDGGCGTGVTLDFWYKFIANDYLPYNDCMTILIEGGDKVLLSTTTVCVSNVGNYGSTDWTQKSIDLGTIAAGSNLMISIAGSVTDGIDTVNNSDLLLDGFEITYY